MKRDTPFLSILLLFFSLSPLFAQIPHILTEEDVIISNGEITDYRSSYTAIIIPPFLKGQTITSIGSRAFNNEGLISVTIPNTVTKIGFNAFYSNLLASVIIPNSVTEIGNSAFGFNRITSLVIPSNIREIGQSVFRNNQLTSVVIPTGVAKIGNSAFTSNQLVSIQIPNSVYSVESNAFSSNQFSSFTLPTPVAEGAWNIGAGGEESPSLSSSYTYTFTDYPANSNDFLFEDGEIKDYYGPTGAVIIPSSINGEQVTSIGSLALYDNQLTSVTIPNTVTEIGERAFYYNALESVTIGNSVTIIGSQAFENNQLVNITIPNSVTNIGNNAFYNNQLTSVIIPNSVTEIGREAFYSNRLTSVTLLNGIIKIGEGAFQLNQLSSVSIPNSVTSIGIFAFQSNLLTSFLLPTPPTPGSWSSGAASGQASPSLSLSYDYLFTNYIATDEDFLFEDGEIKDYYGPAGELVIPSTIDGEQVTSIGVRAFQSNQLSSVTIPNSVVKVDDYAFSNNQLTSVIIPNSVVNIDDFAFSNNQLTSVIIPTNITVLGDYAFSSNRLTSVTIPSNITAISTGAFSNNRLTSLSIPTNITEIGVDAFSSNLLTSVTIPDNISVISASTFSNNRLTSVTIPSNITEIGSSAFSSNQLASVVIPNSVTKVGQSAFYNNLLTSVTISNSITEIGLRTFSRNQLTSVTIPNNVTNIGYEAFSDNQLTSVVIPEGVTKIGSQAFSNNQLTSIVVPNSVLEIGSQAFLSNVLTGFTMPTPTVEGVWSIGTAGQPSPNLTSYHKYYELNYVPKDEEFLFEDGEIRAYYGPQGGGVVIPATINGEPVISIGQSVFYNKNLTKVTISDGITKIGNGAFSTNSITSVSIPSSVIKIDRIAFASNQLATVTIPNSVIEIGDRAFSSNQLTSFTLPSPSIAGAWSIGTAGQASPNLTDDYYYYMSNYLAEDKDFLFEGGEIKDYYGPAGGVVIPSTINGEQVISIGSSAFSRNQLTNVTIPNSVTSIGFRAFSDNQLFSVTIGNSVSIIGSSAFSDNQLTSITLSNSVTEIGSHAFSGNQLSGITIPNSVVKIDGFTFSNNQLTSVTMPNSVIEIGQGAFSGNQLTSVTIPNSITKIGSSAFWGNQLSSVAIPNSVTEIGSSAFQNNQLSSFILPTPSITGVWSTGTAGQASPTLTDTYRYLLPDYVAEDDDFLFEDGEIRDYYGPGGGVVIPMIIAGQQVVSIGSQAFISNMLTSITIPNSVTVIGDNAFQNNLLTSVTITNSVNKIGSRAFYSNQLVSVIIPNSVTYIGSSAFSNNQLSNVTIPNSVIEIGGYAFSNNQLTSFQLPSPTIAGFVLDGWVTSTSVEYANGDITTDLTSSYQPKVSISNKALISVLFQDFTGDLAVTGSMTSTQSNLGNYNFQIEKGSDLVLTPQVSGLAAGYELDLSSLILNDIQEDAAQIFTLVPISYMISYSGVEDISGYTTNYTIEDADILLNTARKEGYTFDGWYSEAGFENAITSIAAGSTGDMTLYAKFIPIIYNLTFEADGGNQTNPATYTIEDAEIILSAASKEGYTFEGWYTEAGFVNVITSIASGSKGDLTLSAKFIPITVITFIAIDKVYGDADFALEATSNSAGLITYSIVGEANGTSLSGSNNEDVSLGNVGTVMIRATQVADGIYLAATRDMTLTVNKAVLTATIADENKTYGAPIEDLVISYDGFVNGEDESVLSEIIITEGISQETGVGQYNSNFELSASDNYTVSATPATITISPTELTVSVADQTITYGETPTSFDLIYEGFVNGETKEVLSTEPSAASDNFNAGTYDIAISGGAAANYILVYEEGILIINKAPLTVGITGTGITYGEAEPDYPIWFEGFVNGESEDNLIEVPTIATTTTTVQDAGEYTIAITPVAADDNYEITYQDAILEVQKKRLTATANDKTMTYGDQSPEFDMNYEGFVDGEGPEVLDELPIPSSITSPTISAGSYDIGVSSSTDKNYDISKINGTIIVEKAMLTVTIADENKTYGAPIAGLVISYEGFVNGEDESLLPDYTITQGISLETGVGSYPLNIDFGEVQNYEVNITPGTVAISPAELTVSVDDQTITYGETPVLFDLTYVGFVNGETEEVITAPSITSSADGISSTGIYDIILSGGSATNYILTLENGSLTVNKANLSVAVDNVTKLYGAVNPRFTQMITGYVNGENESVLSSIPAISTSAGQSSGVGTYDLISTGGIADNYGFEYVSGTLIISKAPLIATADNKTKTYGQVNPVLTATYTGFINGDTEAAITAPVISTSVGQTSDVGIYDIILSGGSSTNYGLTLQNGSFSVDKAGLLVAAEGATKVYGDANPTLTQTITGYANGEDESALSTVPQIATEATEASDVGVYTVSSSSGLADNYEFTYIDGAMTVTKATLLVTADDQSISTSESFPDFTAEYSGFKNDDTLEDLDEQPVAAVDPSAEGNLGAYDIVLSGGADNNYDFSFEAGILTITARLSTDGLREIIVYPNPTTTSFEVEATKTESVTLHDLNGNLILESKTNQEIVVSQLAKGTYLLLIGNKSHRLIIN